MDLTRTINSEVENWNIKFGVSVNPIKPEDIVKNLLSHYVEDVGLGGQQIDLSSFGQGLQRHLIFTLIKLSAKYATPKATKKKDFNPDFNLILFEEPEAFLHPSQQEALHTSLRTLAFQESEQVLISSHSPHFVSKQISELRGIIRLGKEKGVTDIFQVDSKEFEDILDENLGLYKKFCDCLQDQAIDDSLKQEIRRRKLGDDEFNSSLKLDEEAVKYFLWLDTERASLFFSKKVIICEGASEKIFIDYLFDEKWPEFRDKHIYMLDAMGKYNIHRYISILTKLGIRHSILMDKDSDEGVNQIINTFIQDSKSELTGKIHSFENDFEEFLGIEKPQRNDLKPLNIIVRHQNNEISEDKLEELKGILTDC